MSADWVNVAVTAVLGVVGLYLVHSLSRQARVTRETTAVEKRFDIYSKLWAIMKEVPPMSERLEGRPFPEHRRRPVYNRMTAWFFEDAGGMVLGEPARSIYLKAKENLGTEDLNDLEPARVRGFVNTKPEDEREETRRRIAVRQLSLLRTAMRADLGIFGKIYGGPLSEEDKAFLRCCGARLWRRPWWPRTGSWWKDDWGGRFAEWRRRWDHAKPPCRPDDRDPSKVSDAGPGARAR